MSAENDTGIDAYELAMLAAQIDETPAQAIDRAWELFESAKRKFEMEEKLRSPETQAEWQREKDEHLAKCKPASFAEGVKWITSQTRLDRANKSFKDFLTDKAKARGELTSDGVEARAEAMLITYRNRGFTGAEVRKLKAEWEQWRGKGRQGRVKKPASDGRFRENKRKKLLAKGKAAMAELTQEKPQWRTKHYRQSALKGARGKGKQGRDYRDPSNPENDIPGNTLGGKTLEDDPALQAALNDPAPA
jgi:hypothetical protein